MFMEQIVFFSSYPKLKSIDISLEIPTIGFIVFTNESLKSTYRIILIDENNGTDQSQLLDGYNNYIVYHDQTLKNAFYLERINSVITKIEDHHIKSETIIYHEIINIKSGFDDQKFNELKHIIIKNSNLKLNATLKFLNNSFEGTIGSASILTSGDLFTDNELNNIRFKGNSIYDIITDLKNKSGREYYGKLEDLRDALLTLIGVINRIET
jgi:hypothetical protein